MVLLAPFLCIGTAWGNDTFPGTVLTGTSGTVTGTTVGATGQTSENTTYGGGNLNTIWYSWTAPASGVFTAATCNLGAETTTSFDTTLIAYTGAAFPLTVISTNDDATGCSTTANANWGSVVTFNATAGTTYRLQVDGYASNTGTYVLRYGLVGLTTNVTDNTATEGGDTAANYFTRTECVAGVQDARFQELMPDVLHWLGVDRVDRLVSMSNMKYESLVTAGIEIGERVPIPDGLIPSDASVEMEAKKAAGYYAPEGAPSADDLARTSGRPLEKY